MITSEMTIEKVEEYRKLYQKRRNALKPSRKSGQEVERYLVDTCNAVRIEHSVFKKVVEDNILTNDFKREKLPNGVRPNVKVYALDDVLVGIDTVSGEFHVECNDINKMAEIYDNLFVFRGLDEADLNNFVLVGKYIKCFERRNSNV